MRVNDEYRHFVAIVIGDDPEACMEPYDMNKECDLPYVVYKLEEAPYLHKEYIKFIEALLNADTIDEDERKLLNEDLASAREMDDLEFFYMITSEYDYDLATGDAITRKNPYGRWCSKSIGHRFALPFKLKDGTETYQARKKDIDWEKVHLSGQDIYESAWDLVMEGKTPENEQEETIFENMKNRTAYFEKFGTKENYVISSTAFWGLALVDDEHWEELEDDMDQFEWMRNFYTKFIEPLPDDTLISIYECRRA